MLSTESQLIWESTDSEWLENHNVKLCFVNQIYENKLLSYM